LAAVLAPGFESMHNKVQGFLDWLDLNVLESSALAGRGADSRRWRTACAIMNLVGGFANENRL